MQGGGGGKIMRNFEMDFFSPHGRILEEYDFFFVHE